MKTKLIFTAVAMIVFIATSNAQLNGKGNGTCKGAKTEFVDANGDGICDNYKQHKGHGALQGKGQKSGKGVKQNKGKGVNFVDKNNNGICDTKE